MLNKSSDQGDPLPDDRRFGARFRRPHDGRGLADAQVERRIRGVRRGRLRRLSSRCHMGIGGNFWWVAFWKVMRVVVKFGTCIWRHFFGTFQIGERFFSHYHCYLIQIQT